MRTTPKIYVEINSKSQNPKTKSSFLSYASKLYKRFLKQIAVIFVHNSVNFEDIFNFFGSNDQNHAEKKKNKNTSSPKSFQIMPFWAKILKNIKILILSKY